MFSKPSAYKSVNSSQMQFYHHHNINPNPNPNINTNPIMNPSFQPTSQSIQSKVIKI
jgi:hypothetical protein